MSHAQALGDHAAGRRVRILPLGDSLTQGTGSSDLAGYRFPLWRHLWTAGHQVRLVGSLDDGPSTLPCRAHEGHYGYTTAQLAADAGDWVTSAEPDIVLLHTGTNDIVQGRKPEKILVQWAELIDAILCARSTTEIIVAQIIPLAYPTLDERATVFNALVADAVGSYRQRGMRIEVVDMHSRVTPAHLTDRIHPFDSGYACMATVWLEAVRRLLEGATDNNEQGKTTAASAM